MIIEILNQKYKCGCEKGMAELKVPGILLKLNSIIEWDFCVFPQKVEELDETEEVVIGTDDSGNEIKETRKKTVIIEDRNFLGEDPELKPGNVFLYKGQVIAVDSPDRLILIVSETGCGALDRIYEENMKTEFDLMFNDYQIENVTYKVVEDGVIPPEYDMTFPVPYNLYNIWKERFVAGRGFLEKGLCLEVTMEAEEFIFPVNFIMTDWNIRYKSDQFEEGNEEMVEVAIKELLSHFYESYQRIKPLERHKDNEERTINI